MWSESRTNENKNFQLGTQTYKPRKNMNTLRGLISVLVAEFYTTKNH